MLNSETSAPAALASSFVPAAAPRGRDLVRQLLMLTEQPLGVLLDPVQVTLRGRQLSLRGVVLRLRVLECLVVVEMLSGQPERWITLRRPHRLRRTLSPGFVVRGRTLHGRKVVDPSAEHLRRVTERPVRLVQVARDLADLSVERLGGFALPDAAALTDLGQGAVGLAKLPGHRPEVLGHRLNLGDPAGSRIKPQRGKLPLNHHSPPGDDDWE
jgi:ribosomal protein L34